ncbi:MAG TPA: ABC transporter permease [Planctomycetota bacterium]|nr:ABC transporter permease [Planctomycetota bacterium]
MLSIGWRNLKRDRMRAAIAVVGVVFAVVLVTLEVGMLLGLVRNASLLIDESRADLWISTVDVKTFDFATPFERRKLYRLQAIEGVERVEEYNVSYSVWKLPGGGNANIQVVAFDDQGTLAADLNLVAGSVADLHNQDAVIIDEGDRAKLGNPQLGDWVEIMQRRARVVGFTRNMRSFTTTPYVFTSLRRGENYGWLASGEREQSIYFLVKLKRGADVSAVQAAISAAIPDIEVHSRESFSWRTRRYWLVETGMGASFLAAALLGLLVGGVIVSQTLYAMTIEKLPEFGVLKALGATMLEISRVVFEQSLLCGGAGLAVGIAISHGLAALAAFAGTTIEIPVLLIAGIAILTAGLCLSAAFVSIWRLKRLEPGMVFRT